MEKFELDKETSLEHLPRQENQIDSDSDAGDLDCEIPELVFFQLQLERDYQIIKDICIDREIPATSKCLVENCDLDHDIIASLLNSSDHEETDGKSAKAEPNTVSAISNSSETFSEHDCMRNEDVNTELDVDYSHLQLFDSKNGGRGEQIDNKFKDPSKQPTLATSMASTASETRSINYDCSSSVNTATGIKAIPGITDLQPPLTIVNMSRPEDEMSESLRVSSHQTYDRGETSFSAVGPVLSGPVSYSGSNSLRSNSCNSTRSFTFPVLQWDWNDSPVRMEEANARDLKKHRRWKTVFCCKF